MLPVCKHQPGSAVQCGNTEAVIDICSSCPISIQFGANPVPVDLQSCILLCSGLIVMYLPLTKA